ncbi:M42 family metallopeptidase [Fimbriimonas ginsengisoli]|uniref:Peptidase M42 family protein n=1 Tax=Fimbriimonas ginsengisoli Gsoil 348 TaxID=661478 RepID=A0A068NQQ2_FIMGI|nr:M42 family metallopeptidase [Fimbriimonas ginsengisoli]AIE85707.1 peptidase M42 family protein [Fimbriimonas ginsengisoli Gsoil 348]
MRPESLEFFKAIVNVPSPSGYEERAAEIYRNYTRPFADDVRTDVHGNVAAILNPQAEMRIMLAGHMDEIGFIVHYISDEGLLYFSGIGGHDSVIPIGQRVWVHGKEKIPGIIGRKAIHLLKDDERKRKPDLEDLWIDIGATSRAQVEEVMEIGDVVTFQYEFEMLMNDRATARGFDNKMGSFIVAEALRLLKEDGGLDPGVGVYATATVQEEIGLRGARTSAYWINAQSGLAVDVNHAIDYPSVSKTKHGALDVGKGPSVMRGANANPNVVKMIRAGAAAEEIPYQIDVAPGGTGTDGNAMQLNRAGMAVGIVGVALRYMHTPCELLSLTDVENCARLMAAYCRQVKPETDFTPRLP